MRLLGFVVSLLFAHFSLARSVRFRFAFSRWFGFETPNRFTWNQLGESIKHIISQSLPQLHISTHSHTLTPCNGINLNNIVTRSEKRKKNEPKWEFACTLSLSVWFAGVFVCECRSGWRFGILFLFLFRVRSLFFFALIWQTTNHRNCFTTPLSSSSSSLIF